MERTFEEVTADDVAPAQFVVLAGQVLHQNMLQQRPEHDADRHLRIPLSTARFRSCALLGRRLTQDRRQVLPDFHHGLLSGRG